MVVRKMFLRGFLRCLYEVLDALVLKLGLGEIVGVDAASLLSHRISGAWEQRVSRGLYALIFFHLSKYLIYLVYSDWELAIAIATIFYLKQSANYLICITQ